MQEEDIRNTKDWRVENLKGTIALAGQTIKSLEIINGGAAIAVLTFYGHSSLALNKNALMFSLIMFGTGVASAVGCAFFSYLAQRLATLKDDRELNMFWTAIGLAGLSVVLFIIGLVAAGSSLPV